MTISSPADDPKHWRNRAHEARADAGELNDPAAKRQMLGIARGYDRLADRAEERARDKYTVLPLVDDSAGQAS